MVRIDAVTEFDSEFSVTYGRAGKKVLTVNARVGERLSLSWKGLLTSRLALCDVHNANGLRHGRFHVMVVASRLPWRGMWLSISALAIYFNFQSMKNIL